MGMTMTQKILAAHAGVDSVKAGDLIMADLDLVLGNDITSPVAINVFKNLNTNKVFDQDKVALVPDHFAPNKDIKAAIISAHTGRKVSGKTVQRQERTARLVEERLVPEWRGEAVAGNLTDADIERLSKLDPSEQRRLFSAGEKPGAARESALEAALRKAASQLSKAEAAASEGGMTEAARSLMEDVKASVTRLEEASW